MKRYLITTADERSWPADRPVLFLGEWCRLYNRKSVWERLDAEVVPYHWDDRAKLHRDYLWIADLYEELLEELTARLNEAHGVRYGVRYWRILVGPWLGYFVQMLFDRWAMIEAAVTRHAIEAVRLPAFPPEHVVARDMRHFDDLYIEEEWNEAIYGELLERWTAVPVEKVQFDAALPTQHAGVHQAPPVVRLKRAVARGASIALQPLVRDNEAFFIATYLPVGQDLRLQWRLGQVPKLWRPFTTPNVSVDWARREWSGWKSDQRNFAAIARAMVARHIPTAYLEGYAALRALCSRLPWPANPRLIFTSNAFNSDDVFKAWAAEKVEAGAPLVIGQHGGNYGQVLWGFSEDHERAIADLYLSWGWKEDDDSQLKPVGNFKLGGERWSWSSEGRALMVEMALPRYSYQMYSIPVASQWLDYFQDQCNFVSTLPGNIRDQLDVRLHPLDFGFCAGDRWRERFPDLRLDEGRRSLAAALAQSRICISTYNATTYLESLSKDVPTLMFWNPGHWELRAEAAPYFDALKSVGILHDSPESAARKLTEIWDNIAGWWEEKSLQTVRRDFCLRFSKPLDRPVEVLEPLLRQVARRAASASHSQMRS